jgi:hypothetical protein
MNENLLLERIASAPPEIKKILASNEWKKTVDDISLKKQLSEDQSEALSKEIVIVLLGLDIYKNFINNIEVSLRVPISTAFDISKEVDRALFKQISHLLPQEIQSDEKLLDEGNNHLISAPKPNEQAEDSLQINPAFSPQTDFYKAKEELISPGPKVDTAPHVHIPTKSAVEAKLEELKKTAEGMVLEKQYPGNDPYRETLG